jgi:hypothetical protein
MSHDSRVRHADYSSKWIVFLIADGECYGDATYPPAWAMCGEGESVKETRLHHSRNTHNWEKHRCRETCTPLKRPNTTGPYNHVESTKSQAPACYQHQKPCRRDTRMEATESAGLIQSTSSTRSNFLFAPPPNLNL